MPGAKTFADYWAIETRANEETDQLLHAMIQGIEGLAPGLAHVQVAAQIYEPIRKIAFAAWLDGRLSASSQPSAVSPQPEPRTLNPEPYKRKLAALGRAVSSLKVAHNRLLMGALTHQTQTESDIDDLERRANAIDAAVVTAGTHLEEIAKRIRDAVAVVEQARTKQAGMVQRMDELSQAEIDLREILRDFGPRIAQTELYVKTALQACHENRQTLAAHMQACQRRDAAAQRTRKTRKPKRRKSTVRYRGDA